MIEIIMILSVRPLGISLLPLPLSLPDCSGLPGVPPPGFVSVCKPQSLGCVQYHLTSSVREITVVLNLNDANNAYLKYTV